MENVLTGKKPHMYGDPLGLRKQELCRAGFCLLLLVLLFLLPAQAIAQQGGDGTARGIIVGGGVDYSNFVDAEPLVEEDLTSTGFTLEKSGFDFTISGEFVFLDWLGAGAGYENIKKVTLDQQFDVDGFRNFTSEVRDATFDPRVFEIYAMPFWRASDLVRVYGMVGVGFWSADSTAIVVLLFEGDQLSQEILAEENSGTTAVFGGGVDVWPHQRVGFRVGYKYLRFKDGDDVDEPVHNIRLMVLVGF